MRIYFWHGLFLCTGRTNPVLNIDFNTTPDPVPHKAGLDPDRGRSVKTQPDTLLIDHSLVTSVRESVRVLIRHPSQEWLSAKHFGPECVLQWHKLSFVNDLSLIEGEKKNIKQILKTLEIECKPCAFCFQLKLILQRLNGHWHDGYQIQICKLTI